MEYESKQFCLDRVVRQNVSNIHMCIHRSPLNKIHFIIIYALLTSSPSCYAFFNTFIVNKMYVNLSFDCTYRPFMFAFYWDYCCIGVLSQFEMYSMKSAGGIIRFTVGELNGNLRSCATNAPIQLLQKIDTLLSTLPYYI